MIFNVINVGEVYLFDFCVGDTRHMFSYKFRRA